MIDVILIRLLLIYIFSLDSAREKQKSSIERTTAECRTLVLQPRPKNSCLAIHRLCQYNSCRWKNWQNNNELPQNAQNKGCARAYTVNINMFSCQIHTQKPTQSSIYTWIYLWHGWEGGSLEIEIHSESVAALSLAHSLRVNRPLFACLASSNV